MKVAFFMMLLITMSCRKTLEERIKIILENKEFMSQVTKVIDSFKSKNFTYISNTLVETYFKVKNSGECLLIPCDTCKDREAYKKCSKNCWSGFFCNVECLDRCEDIYCNGNITSTL